MPVRFSTAGGRLTAAAVDRAVVGRPLVFLASTGRVVAPAGIDGATPLGTPLTTTGGGLFLSDSFTGAAGTDLTAHPGELGATWSRHAARPNGQIVLTAQNRARHANAIEAVYVAAGAPPAAEYDVVGNLYVAATAPINGMALLLARLDTTTAAWYGVGYDVALGRWVILRQTGTGVVTLATASASLTVGRTYEVTAQIRTGAKTLLVDGTSVCTTADNVQTIAGRAGLLLSGDTATDATGLHWADVLGRPA